MATEHLEEHGYRVVAFASGREAVGAMDSMERPDLLVTDVMMPGIGGVELVRRARERWPGLPVIYMSGQAGPDSPLAGVGEPGTRFLQKPFRLTELENEVRATLAERASAVTLRVLGSS